MHTRETASPPIELCIAHKQNRVRIETDLDRAIIHAARDNLSTREKSLLIRYLAAEGFIPQRYEWFADAETAPFSGLTWLIDSDGTHNSEPHRKALRQIMRVVLATLLLLLVLMTYAFLQSPR